MDPVTRLVRALLLPALLLAVASSPGEAKELCPRPCHCPGRGLLDCRHAGLATVPLGSRHRVLTVLDFTDNSISKTGKRAWNDYPWTETLVLRDNELRAVKSHSLEGLFLLKHLDLSGNEIVSIEERAFESLPFLKSLNLSRNGLTQIRSGTFQAWHGMQFLQELILSHNPLAVIADASFFKLPSVRSLDLSATRVTPQTLLLFLQSTVSLETLQVPKDVACCLCQERPLPESPCRTIQFLCEKLCSSSAPQCAPTDRMRQTRAEITDTELLRELNSSPVLRLKPKEPFLGDHGTVTLAVALTLSTEGDVSSQDNSRTNSYSPQHLLGHEVKMSVDDKAKSIKTVKSIAPYQPQPAWLKDVVEETPSSWDQKEMQLHLNWQALNPWDVAGGLNPADDASITGHPRDVEEDPAPRQNFIRTQKQYKEDSQYGVGRSQLFHLVRRSLKMQLKPGSDQGLNKNLDFLSHTLVPSHPAAAGGHILIIPDTSEEQGSMFLNKPGSHQGPHIATVPKELLKTTVHRHLHLLEPDKGLRAFMAHVDHTLRTDCKLPQLQRACAKMISKTRLLLKLIREREENQGASDPMGHCRLQENMSIHMALGGGKKLRAKKLEVVVYVVTFVVLLAFFVIVFLILKCISNKRSRPREFDSQPWHTRNYCVRRFFAKVPQKGKKENKEAQTEQKGAGSSSQCCPSSDAVHGTFRCFSLFSKSELPWLQRIREAYDSQR